MITYTYRCSKCEVVFEVKQKMKDDALADCSECGSEGTLSRIIQPAGGFRIGGRGVHRPTSRFGS